MPGKGSERASRRRYRNIAGIHAASSRIRKYDVERSTGTLRRDGICGRREGGHNRDERWRRTRLVECHRKWHGRS